MRIWIVFVKTESTSGAFNRPYVDSMWASINNSSNRVTELKRAMKAAGVTAEVWDVEGVIADAVLVDAAKHPAPEGGAQ